MIIQNLTFRDDQNIEGFEPTMKYITHSHHCSPDDWNDVRVAEVNILLSSETLKQRPSARDLRQPILKQLQIKGWSLALKLSQSSGITITAIKANMGLCFQTGNMGRFYADLLKLQYLYNKHTILSAIYILPDSNLARSIGSNCANFERMIKELAFFDEIITVPLFVIGLTLEDK
jgi:hypothetical protein